MREEYAIDPTLAPNMNDFIEDNLSNMVGQSDFYNHVQ